MATEVPSADGNGTEVPSKDGNSSSSPSRGNRATMPNKSAVREEKKEDDNRSAPNASATHQKSSTPTDSILPVNMPNSIMTTPNNRPPSRSSLSVQSAGSTGGRTTTSRRGGRTRSRSPTSIHGSNLQPYGGGRPPSTTPSVPSEVGHPGMGSNIPPSPRNLSAAAAAAAAAAKSFRNPNFGSRGSASGMNSSMHRSSMRYPPQQQQQPPYGNAMPGGPSSMRDSYARQSPPQSRQDPYSSRYPGGPPSGQRQSRPPSSASTSYPGGPPPPPQQQQQPQAPQQPQRPNSRSSSSYPGGPPPGYYDPHNGSRNPSSSSHHQYHRQHPRNSSRGPPPPGSRYDPQPPPPVVGQDGRPLSRNGPGDPQNPYGYNPYHRGSGAPSSSRGGMPMGSGREYGSQYPGRTSNSSSRYGGPPGGGPSSAGPVDTGEYGRQPHHGSSSASSSHRGHSPPPPHHRRQYSQGAGGPPPPSGHHGPPPSSSRGMRQPYPGGSSSSSSSSRHHPSYRHGDPNARGPPPQHYRGGAPPSHQPQHSSSRGGPPPGHPEYHRYHSQQQQLKQHQKGGGGGGGSTRTVIGTATPLHVNKGGPLAPAPGPPGGPQHSKPQGHQNSPHSNSMNMSTRRDSMPSSSRRGSAASVFRGRPGAPGGGEPPPSGGAPSSNNNSKSILDSLETPSNSFEEKKSSRGERTQQGKDSQELSPEDPPKLRNPANNGSVSNGGRDLVFDPQPSPKSQSNSASGSGGITMSPPQLTNSLDMAPSFSLFNQSFDSLGDTAQFFNVGGALDSAMLNSSTSFELKTSGSRSPSSSADQGLQLSASHGTFKLNASMSGGGLFGMSPTNSFGNGPTTSFQTNTPGGNGGSVTILGGGSDHGRSSSPSQLLDLYKNGNGGSIEEADLRLSASLGSPMIGASGSYSSSRPFVTGVEGSPPQPALSGGDCKSSSSGSSGRRNHLSPRPQRHYSGQQPSSSHHSYRPQRASSAGPPNKDGSPRFYNFLRDNSDAFSDVTFLLPELKKAVMESKANTKTVKGEFGSVSNENTPKRGHFSRGRNSRYSRIPTEAEATIARRRITSAVCAFGGTFIGSRMNNPTPPNNSSPDTSASSSKSGMSKSNNQSIFREKSSEPATVTPNSSGSSSAARTAGTGNNKDSKVSPDQARYDGALPTRYYESDNRLSWEFEENPPIGESKLINLIDPGENLSCNVINPGGKMQAERPNKKIKTDTGGKGVTGDSDDEETTMDSEEGDTSKKTKDGKGESPKMRYRCKLCGQPKIDHVCPYRQSLVRSIGIMVYPAVNAFTAAEPGQLAPALTEMNNMAISIAAVNAENNAKMAADKSSPSRPTPDRFLIRGSGDQIDAGVSSSAVQVTPESLRSGGGPVRGPDDLMTPGGSSHVGTPGGSSTASSRRGGRSGTLGYSSSPQKKRSHARMNSGNSGDQADLLFLEEMELRTEQFRIVTPSKVVTENPDAFTYPALPLPYAQRKRLSDNLFSLSKEIPQLTDECAAVLREARERDLWDLAVAELMTQVVVVVHCSEGDTSFEGLSRYLLTLGFTC